MFYIAQRDAILWVKAAWRVHWVEELAFCKLNVRIWLQHGERTGKIDYFQQIDHCTLGAKDGQFRVTLELKKGQDFV